jgi:hypothetical protein
MEPLAYHTVLPTLGSLHVRRWVIRMLSAKNSKKAAISPTSGQQTVLLRSCTSGNLMRFTRSWN